MANGFSGSNICVAAYSTPVSGLKCAREMQIKKKLNVDWTVRS